MVKTCTSCGHEKPLTEFYTKGRGATAQCKVCIKKAVAEYQRKNKEKIRATQCTYRMKNPERIKDRNRAAYLSNPQKYAEQRDKRRNTHPYHSWFFASRLVKIRAGHEFTVTWEEIKAVLEDQGYRCALTGIPFYQSVRVHGVSGWDSPSLDRLDWARGYTSDNVRVVLHCVNSFRGRMSDDDMYAVAEALIKSRGQ